MDGGIKTVASSRTGWTLYIYWAERDECDGLLFITEKRYTTLIRLTGFQRDFPALATLMVTMTGPETNMHSNERKHSFCQNLWKVVLRFAPAG